MARFRTKSGKREVIDLSEVDFDRLQTDIADAGLAAWTRKEVRAFLVADMKFPREWHNAIIAELLRRGPGRAGTLQKNGLYRNVVRRYLSGLVDDLFERFCQDLPSWLGLPAEERLRVGGRLETASGTLVVTDLDTVGWVRLERDHLSGRSVIHASFRTKGGRADVSFAEGNLRNQEMCVISSKQWLMVLNALSKGASPI